MITIIVLLVLAGVSISLVLGANGVIEKSQKATVATRDAEEKEKIEMAVVAAQTAGNGVLTEENLVIELRKMNSTGILGTETEKGWKYSTDKNYNIYKAGKVEEQTSLLPREYQQVEYIESTGGQYIDTLFKPNQDTIMWCDCIITDTFKSGYYQGLCGVATGTNELNRMAMHMGDKTKKVCGIYYDYRKGYGYFSGDITSRHVYKMEKNIYKVDDDVIYTGSIINFQSQLSITIFKENNTISPGKRDCLMKLYNFIIYDNDVLKRNYIPCYSTTTVTDVDGKQRPSGTKGLYDLVEGKFYTNQATGDDFKAGPDI